MLGKMSTNTWVFIFALMCIIAYLMGVIDANEAVYEKRLWECQNPDKRVDKDWFSAEELENNLKYKRNQ